MLDEQKVENEALQELSQDAAPVEQQEQPEQAKETEAERNFKVIREERERFKQEAARLQRERDEAYRARYEYEAQMRQQYQQPQQPVVNEIDNLKDDELIEARHLKQNMKKMQQEMEQLKQQNAMAVIETQLKTKYADFDDVVSQENLNALKQSNPEIFKTIYTSSDLYSKGAAAYQLIKKFVGQQPAAEQPSYMADKQKIVQNAARPRNVNTLKPQQSTNPLDNANSFVSRKAEMEHKKQIYEHMQNYATSESIPFVEIKGK
jgi:hypothetical protein